MTRNILKEGKALERIERLCRRPLPSPDQAVLIGIAEGVAEIGEQSIPAWLEEQHQRRLVENRKE